MDEIKAEPQALAAQQITTKEELLQKLSEPCTCSIQGFCPVFNREMAFTDFRLCRSGNPVRQKRWAERTFKHLFTKPVAKDTGEELVEVLDSYYPAIPSVPVSLQNSVRHLHYCLFPLGGKFDWVWRKNLTQLITYQDVINGVVDIRVMLGRHEGSATPNRQEILREIEKLPFKDKVITFYENCKELREVQGFIRSLGNILSHCTSDNDFICFAHAKGVTHEKINSTVHGWTDMLYELTFKHWETNLRALETFGVSGSFKRYREFDFPYSHKWHYSGSFYWMRASTLKLRNWELCPVNAYGSEAYPGILFRPEEGFCLFNDFTVNCYDLKYFERVKKLYASFTLPKVFPTLQEYLEKLKQQSPSLPVRWSR